MKDEINFRFIGVLVILLVALIVLYIYMVNKPETTTVLKPDVLVENTITIYPDTVLEPNENELSSLKWDTVVIEEVYSGAVVYRPEVEHNYCE